MGDLITWRSIEERSGRDYSTLSEPERVWYNATRVTICVRNGSLISYYYNGYAEHVDDLLISLSVLGADDMLALVKRMNVLFGEPMPKSLEGLNDVIDSWEDGGPEEDESDRIAEVEQAAADQVDELLIHYSRVHGIEV